MDVEIKCIICKAKTELVQHEIEGYMEGQNFDIYFCKSCNTSFAMPRTIDEEIYNIIYSNSDVIPGYNRYAFYAHEVLKKKKPLDFLAEKEAMYYAVKEITHSVEKKNFKILEVGSGLGYLTYALYKAGYQIKGMDISRNAVNSAQEKFGDHFICEDLYEFEKNNNSKWDMVLLTEVIEHIPDPCKFSSTLLKVLKPGGKLVMSTPNKSAFANEIWYTELPPIHLSWFSEESLKALAKEIGGTIAFFDFHQFNKKHLDFSKLKFSKLLKQGESIKPTLDNTGRILRPKSLINKGPIQMFNFYFKNMVKSILFPIIIVSPFVDKANFQRNSILCAILTKVESQKII